MNVLHTVRKEEAVPGLRVRINPVDFPQSDRENGMGTVLCAPLPSGIVDIKWDKAVPDRLEPSGAHYMNLVHAIPVSL